METGRWLPLFNASNGVLNVPIDDFGAKSGAKSAKVAQIIIFWREVEIASRSLSKVMARIEGYQKWLPKILKKHFVLILLPQFNSEEN